MSQAQPAEFIVLLLSINESSPTKDPAMIYYQNLVAQGYPMSMQLPILNNIIHNLDINIKLVLQEVYLALQPVLVP